MQHKKNFIPISATISPELLEKITAEAERVKLTRSWIIRSVLESYFEKCPKKENEEAKRD